MAKLPRFLNLRGPYINYSLSFVMAWPEINDFFGLVCVEYCSFFLHQIAGHCHCAHLPETYSWPCPLPIILRNSYGGTFCGDSADETICSWDLSHFMSQGDGRFAKWKILSSTAFVKSRRVAYYHCHLMSFKKYLLSTFYMRNSFLPSTLRHCRIHCFVLLSFYYKILIEATYCP